MGEAVDDDSARPADAFAAVVVERDGRLVLGDEALVDHIQHLQERHLGADVAGLIGREAALVLGTLLTPHVELEVHL